MHAKLLRFNVKNKTTNHFPFTTLCHLFLPTDTVYIRFKPEISYFLVHPSAFFIFNSVMIILITVAVS